MRNRHLPRAGDCHPDTSLSHDDSGFAAKFKTRCLKGLLYHHAICSSFSSWNKNTIAWEFKLQASCRNHSALVKPIEGCWYTLTLRRGENVLDTWCMSQTGNFITLPSHFTVWDICLSLQSKSTTTVSCWNVARITKIPHLIIPSCFDPPSSFSKTKACHPLSDYTWWDGQATPCQQEAVYQWASFGLDIWSLLEHSRKQNPPSKRGNQFCPWVGLFISPYLFRQLIA